MSWLVLKFSFLAGVGFGLGVGVTLASCMLGIHLAVDLKDRFDEWKGRSPKTPVN